MDDVAIKVDQVCKTFKLPHERNNTIKSLLVNLLRGGDLSYENLDVLSGVSFEVKRGEFFGIVGRNGSGKSTLLKLLAGIYTQTKGDIHVSGKLTPFIELGVGFNPELTGRENVFLNGALLGFSRSEMEKMYGEIVRFAELERFMDQRLKNYSSGMQVRLAFSIAIRANTDILVLDEVLAVGDEAFQKKCFSYFEELKRTKRTVILVTHDMAAVERYCTRALLIEDGVVKNIGEPRVVAAAYSRSNDINLAEEKEVAEQEVVEESKEENQAPLDLKIALINSKLIPSQHFAYNESMTVRLSWTNPKVRYVGVSIMRQSGEFIYGTNSYQDKVPLKDAQSMSYKLKLNLGEGNYFIKAAIFGRTDKDIIEFEEKGPSFTVQRDYEGNRWGGFTKLEDKWIP